MRRAAPIVAALSACVLAGCGEKTFTATGFVDEANDRGAMLELGEPLPTSLAGKKLYTVSLRGVTDEGTLTVYDDVGAANDGTTQCEATTELLCFQAGNVVLFFEGERAGPPEARLAAAIERMAQ